MKCMEKSQAGNRSNQLSQAPAMFRTGLNAVAAWDGKEAVEIAENTRPAFLETEVIPRPHFANLPSISHSFSQHKCMQVVSEGTGVLRVATVTKRLSSGSGMRGALKNSGSNTKQFADAYVQAGIT